jgi:2-polyprenyl-6-hydroxyphenyl methylase/3-demethylubiquinone-9 3-methyltransferase
MHAFYAARASTYRDLSSRVGEREARVLQFFPQRKGLRVFDFGCGSGRFLRIVKDLGHEPLGMDISQEAVEAVRASGISAVRGDASALRDLEKAQGRFDVVTALDVIEHTFDPGQVLAELASLVSTGGVLIVSVPNIGCIVGRLHLLLGQLPHRQSGLFDFGHIRWFTRSNLGSYTKKLAGFKVAGCTGTPLPPASRYGLWRLEGLQNRIFGGLARAWPSLWGYQLVFKLARSS